MAKYIVNADGYLRVRASPNLNSFIIGVIPTGTVIEADASAGTWASIALDTGSIQIRTEIDLNARSLGYVYAPYLELETPVPPVPPTPVPPPVTVNHYLGINVIGQGGIAKELSSLGCKAFVIVDDPGACAAIKLAHPDAVVVNRRWSNDQLTGDQQYAKFGSIGGGVINECFNEADGSHSYGSVEQITTRINYELDWYRHVKAAGHVAALGCFSTGTPDFNNPAICEQMKRYAALYNSDPNVYFSMHNYSPNMQHIYDNSALIWYETRFKFLFEKCGFNPSLRKIIMTETGVDEGGVGGFPAHSASAQQFSNWCLWYQAAMANTQVIASMIFCFTRGMDKKWSPGYEVSQWQGELSRAARW